jgi:two-component system sensor histidine kinase/response regulator
VSSHVPPLAGSYDFRLVVLSIAIAMVASYTALDLVGRVTSIGGRMRAVWLAGGAAAMGVGIWSMHYVGMLAFRLPVPVEYDWPTVLLSLLAAIFASAVALYVVSQSRMEWQETLVGSLLMGGAIAGMHYIGMAAMRLPAMCTYSTGLVLLSVVLAVVFSFVALRLVFGFRRETASWTWHKAIRAALMGAAIPVTHYVGMAAAKFEPTPAPDGNLAHALNITWLGTVGIIIVTFMVMGFAVLSSFADRRLSRQEQELAASERRFRAVFEGAEIGIALSDLATGKIVAVNPAYQKMLGCTREEMGLTDVFDRMTHPDDVKEDQRRIREVVVGERKQLHLDKRYVLGDGTEILADVDFSVLRDPQGDPQFLLRLANDVTRRKRTEAELQMALKAAAAASEAKSTFLATMSHEIRTPMNGVLGMTELLLETELTTEQREQLRLVRVSAESLLAIINDILDFSKIEAGKLELEGIPFDLRDSLGETMRALSFRTAQKGLELIFEVQPDVAETVIGDPGRLRQIVINLVGNSIKFTERGEIFLGVEKESQTESETFLHFTVRDTGIGIPPDKLKKIFEAFSQADGSMARKYGGTGLGLTICVRLTEMMGGRIWVESAPGRGCTFHFTVRLGVQDVPRRPSLLEPEELRDVAALVVDDNHTNRVVLSGILSRWGMRVTLVEGGREALQALDVANNVGRPFALILLDSQMPELDGFALAAKLQKDAGLARLTVMMLTSAGRLGDAKRCRELGIAAYLVKPVRQDELLECVRQVLGKVSPAAAEPLITRHTLREGKRHLRILLAEDNAVNQTLAVRMLEKRGCIVTVAGDGNAVLAALKNDSFDLILMDVQMPEMDGLEATETIRKREKTSGAHIPIVAMTAHAMKEDRDRCLAAGMDGYLTKPIRSQELLNTIENLLEKTKAAKTASGAAAEASEAGNENETQEVHAEVKTQA